MTIVARAKAALHASFADHCRVEIDSRGYTSCPEDNLLPGIDWSAVATDLSRGDGHELGGKFCAIHSSAALAVNSFGPFRTHPHDARLMGQSGAQRVTFEKRLPTSLRGVPPNLDVWIERVGAVVAVESKLLEYLTPTRPHFADAYAKIASKAEPCWQTAYGSAHHGAPQHLDCAQLIKHHFGLRAYGNHHPDQQLSLFYVFWEPPNWKEVAECRRHREEVAAFAGAVSPSCIDFRWMTYSQLWEEWSATPALADHASRLKARYEVCI
jgi:hypothetical protein